MAVAPVRDAEMGLGLVVLEPQEADHRGHCRYLFLLGPPPPLEQTKTLAFGWVGEMLLRNLILMSTVAGGLHLYFIRSPNRA